MNESEEKNRIPGAEAQRAKRPYQKPAIRRERVFETTALSCGKVQETQSSCAHNRKTS
jgi:hypothetical protein